MDPARARLIPAIDALRQLPRTRALDDAFGRDTVLDALRTEAASLRAEVRGQVTAESQTDSARTDAADTDAARHGSAQTASAEAPADATDLSVNSVNNPNPAGDLDSAEAAASLILDRVEARLGQLVRSRLRATINATGVIIHTNLGRAPLSASALQRVVEIGAGYSSLEFDLARGTRGRRDVHAEPLLRHLTGAEAAIVVNNNAAAVLLMLSALAAGREVLISRGELVEIGGGFRIPDVMRQSGAILREVGTTNRTRAADYAAALSDRTALILRVHPSNFVIEGFTARPTLEELTEIGRRFHVPVAEDLGSGFVQTAQGPATPLDEPTVQASLRAGAGVVTFSGDKLLGGPQAGLIAGRRDLVDTMRRHPLMRALRVDKLTYAALEATLVDHVRGRAAETVPVARMLAMSREAIEARARALAAALSSASRDDDVDDRDTELPSRTAAGTDGDTHTEGADRTDRTDLANPANPTDLSVTPAASAATVTRAMGIRTAIIDGVSAVGGGSAPGARLPTRLLAVEVPGLSADALLTHLRAHDPPIIARIADDRVVLDLRTVRPEEDATIAEALVAAPRRA